MGILFHRHNNRRVRRLYQAAAGLAAALVCISASADKIRPSANAKEKNVMPTTLTSAAFLHNGEIPTRHTCDNQDSSPPLSWMPPPADTKSLALIVDDPDAPDPAAPKMTWVHWVLYNIPPSATGLPEGVAANALPPGTLQGVSDWKRVGYRGPCPPVGRHRYFFKLYALDRVLPELRQPTTKAMLEKAMQGHILIQSDLVGTYQRQR